MLGIENKMLHVDKLIPIIHGLFNFHFKFTPKSFSHPHVPCKKCYVPRMFWCQGPCLVTFPECSEMVMLWSSLKGWGTLFDRPSMNIQDVLGMFRGPLL